MKKLLVLLMLVPFMAQAGIYAEPYLGYNFGDGDITAGGTTTTYDLSGTTKGLRLGGSVLGFMAGYEYSQLDMKAKYEDSTKDDSKYTTHGLFAGYTFPSLIPLLGKVWGTYYFAGENKLDNDKRDLDSGVALGFGLAPIPVPLPFVSIHVNFEYRSLEAERNNEVVKDNMYIMSVSLPINI